MGGALKKGHSIDGLPVIGIDETVHDLPAHEDPPDEPSPCHHDPVIPEPQKVLCEDDIIGVRASIVYENSLRQLATFPVLPVDKCTGLLRTGAPCNSVAPFEINITTRGTAATIKCSCMYFLSTNILLSGNNYAKVALLFKFMNMGMVNRNTFFSIQDTYCVNIIKEFWEERRTEALCRLQGKEVVVLGL